MELRTLVNETPGAKDHKVVTIEEEEIGLAIYLDRKKGRKLPCSVCGQRSPLYDAL